MVPVLHEFAGRAFSRVPPPNEIRSRNTFSVVLHLYFSLALSPYNTRENEIYAGCGMSQDFNLLTKLS